LPAATKRPIVWASNNFACVDISFSFLGRWGGGGGAPGSLCPLLCLGPIGPEKDREPFMDWAPRPSAMSSAQLTLSGGGDLITLETPPKKLEANCFILSRFFSLPSDEEEPPAFIDESSLPKLPTLSPPTLDAANDFEAKLFDAIISSSSPAGAAKEAAAEAANVDGPSVRAARK